MELPKTPGEPPQAHWNARERTPGTPRADLEAVHPFLVARVGDVRAEGHDLEKHGERVYDAMHSE